MLGKILGSHRWLFIFLIILSHFYLGFLFCGWFSLDVFWDLIIGFVMCFYHLGCLCCYCFFGFLFIFLGHKIGRHLVLGTGNGAKSSCTLLVIRFYYAGQVWVGWAWVMDAVLLCSAPHDCMRQAQIYCVYWSYFISVYWNFFSHCSIWYNLLISTSILSCT